MAEKRKKTHDWTQFTLKVEIAASPERVFQAWTDTHQISMWFFYGGVIEPINGGKFDMVTIDGDEYPSEILEIRKNRYIRFTFGPKSEQVEVTIKKVAAGAECILHQFNMRTTPNEKWDMHMGCRQGWTFFLTNLKAYLEHGVDLRSHNRRKSYKQGFINS
jgi:uncharacterized protein YndB with AHSA1/START domain